MFRRRSMLPRFAVIAALAVWCGCGEREEEPVPDVPVGVNLIRNPSFEEWEGFMPTGWELKQIAGEGQNSNMFGKSTSEMKSGRYSYFLRGLFNVDKWMVLVQRIPVHPGYEFHFSAEIKCVNIKRNRGQENNANIYVRFLDARGERLNDRYYADAYTKHRLGTGDWRRDFKKVEIPKKARFAEIGLINQMTGYLYFDDIEAMLVESVKWDRIETEYVTFYHLAGHPPPDGAIREETRFVEFLVELTGVSIEQKVSYYYYPSEEKFVQMQGVKKYKQRPLWKKRELHTTAPVEQHAMIHMLLTHLGYPPIGIAKGFVFALRGKYTGWNPHILAKRFLVEKMIPALFRIIEDEPMKKSEWAVTVPAWASFCTYLIDRYGMEEFIDFYADCNGIKEAGPFNDVFIKHFDDEFKVVDRTWRLYILRVKTERPLDSLDFTIPQPPSFGEETIDTMEVPRPGPK